MVEKGEIMRCTYKTIGEISPFSTIPHYPYLWTSAVTEGRGVGDARETTSSTHDALQKMGEGGGG